jgi:hypothetical protein
VEQTFRFGDAAVAGSAIVAKIEKFLQSDNLVQETGLLCVV